MSSECDMIITPIERVVKPHDVCARAREPVGSGSGEQEKLARGQRGLHLMAGLH